MKIVGKIIIGIIVLLVAIFLMSSFGLFNEKVNYIYQKASDNVNYERLKKVEDTARAMIATYKSDKLTYETYKNTDAELAAQAKIRANKDISIKEMHTIDVIGKFPEATPSKVSKELMVTLGTVTTSLNNLERKGYIERIRSDQDRRVVYLHLTKKGRLVHRLHKRFHKAMVEKIIDGMSPEEMDVMGKGLTNLYQFLEDLK